MTREELKKAINFRTIDAPCCGNCKWFRREWEDTNCEHPQNIWHFPEPDFSDDEYNLSFNNEHDVCDRFERRETKDFADMPSTTDEILADLRTRLTPKDDQFGAEEAGLFLGNCGWTAFYGELNTDSALNMTYNTSYEAAAALWKFFFEKRGNKNEE